MIISCETIKSETPIVRVFRGETLVGALPLGRSFATKIKSYLSEVNFGGVRLKKVRDYILIFNSREYEVVVVG